MNIVDLLEQLDEILDKGWSIGNRCLVHGDELKKVIDDIRLNMPVEIKQARTIVSERADIIDSANKKAEEIIKSAEEKARTITAQN